MPEIVMVIDYKNICIYLYNDLIKAGRERLGHSLKEETKAQKVNEHVLAVLPELGSYLEPNPVTFLWYGP